MRRPAARRAFVVFFLGTFLAQVAWIVSMPAFAGIDEFDHVYKAEAVAHGELLSEGQARNGRGELVTVPADVVRAAGPACAVRPYTRHDNCYAVRHVGSGMVTVADAAVRYNPVYYAVVGTLARPFHGAAVDVAMRLATALICALLLGCAAGLTGTWARTRWPFVALVVATTPMLVYSTAIASPNGVSYAAGLLVWAALLALVQQDRSHSATAALVAFVTGSGALVMTHSTGPLWLLIICVVAALLVPLKELWQIVTRHPRAYVIAGSAVLALTLASVAWTRFSGANSLGADLPPSQPLRAVDLLRGEILWVFQTIGVFPYRNEPAPAPTYALWLVAFAVVLITGFRAGRPRDRVALAVLVVLDFAVPTVLTIIAYPYIGIAWQGRYSLPLTVGLFLIAGRALDRRGREPRRLLTVIVLGATTVATLAAVLAVAVKQIHHGVTASIAHSVPGGVVLVFLLALAGALVPVAFTMRRPDLTAAGDEQPVREGELVAGGVR